SPAQEKPAAGAIVSIVNWSDYIDPGVLDDFTSETGIKIVYDTYDSNDTLQARLLAGRSGYDVVVSSAVLLQRDVKAGVYLKLDPLSRSEADRTKAAGLLARIRPFTRKIVAADLIGALARGEICLAVAWAGDALQARARARQGNGELHIDYVVPREGAPIGL